LFDALTDLRRHDLHPLAEFGGKRLRLVSGGVTDGLGVADVCVVGNRAQRNDREQEERNNQSQAKVHGKLAIALIEDGDHRRMVTGAELAQ
jgi:hypothetical protein